MILTALLITLCGFFDRARGTSDSLLPTFVEKLLYGVCIAILAGGYTNYWMVLAVAAAWGLGSSPGWGEPYGCFLSGRKMQPDKLKWWQFGSLKEKVMLALIFRGLMWAAPCAVAAYYFDLWIVPISILIAFPVSLVIAKAIDTIKPELDEWHVSEGVRGVLAGVICAVGATWM